jgi:hypothetical protein
MQNKIITRRRYLENQLANVRYQLANCKQFHSAEQIAVWEKLRQSCIRQLELLPTEAEVKTNAANHTAIIKSILKNL